MAGTSEASDRSPQLSRLQLAILRVLWAEGEQSVSQVHVALAGARELAPTTVATLLRRLEKRGVVTHRTEGRQYLYSATVSEDEATRSMLNEVTERLFSGDVPELLSQLLRSRDVEPGDLDRIRKMIDEHERKST